MIYIVIINIISLIIYGIDKLLAIKHLYRVSEIALITLSIIGGSIGSILGMIIFHHKTKKIKFLILNPLILIIQIIFLIIK
ncbi:MAG: DUF1294 domain-containing protein [Bacilli bacterium]|nr:DUF1294 domain-containing protein [Bacilli bacterium]